MESQKQDTPLQCASCRRPVHACQCQADDKTLVSGGRTVQPGFASATTDKPTLVVSATRSEVGSIIDQEYKLVEMLGEGGMGAVFKAKHTKLPKFFAVKILKHELTRDSDFAARFHQEAKTASLLNHPHLVTIYDYGTTEFGEGFLVMDYIDGHSLADSLTAMHRIDQKQAVKIFIQICEALAHAHGQGIIHRDLKPSNIMLVNTREAADVVKVVDFGIAKMIGGEGNIVNITQSITKTGEFFGSPLYMSPEQGNGGNPDHRTDIYSLGVLMYECLTSAPPFKGDNFFFTMVMHNEAQPKPFDKSLTIDESLETIVMKTLEKNPQDRFQSMDHLREALLDVFPDQHTDPSRKRRSQAAGQKPQKPRSLSPLIGCLAALVTVLAATAYYLTNYPVKQAAKVAPPPAVSKAKEAVAPVASTTPARKANLPWIPAEVKLPESARDLSADQLVGEGDRLMSLKTTAWNNLLPARYFMTAIEKSPDKAWILGKLADYYYCQSLKAPQDKKQGLLENSHAVYGEQEKLFPKDIDAFITRGNIDGMLGRDQDALDDATAAMNLRPEDRTLHLKRGFQLRVLGNLKDALSELEPNIRPGDHNYLYTLASIYQTKHEPDKAIQFCTEMLEKGGPDRGLLVVRADCYKEKEQYQKALNDYLQLRTFGGKLWLERDNDIEFCKKALKEKKDKRLNPQG